MGDGMHVVIHPGLPKAGSTTIQAFTRKFESRLRGLGVGYVQTTERSGAARAQQVLDGVSELATAGLKHGLVSQEALAGWPRVRVNRLIADLKDAGHDVEVVLVVRAYEPWVLSMAMQRVRTLRGSPIREPEPVWEWLEIWRGLSVPVSIIPLGAEDRLLPAFWAAARIDVPAEWLRKGAVALNKSPAAEQFGVFIRLDQAIALAMASDPDVLNGRNAMKIKKLIRGLLDGGEHHRKPIVVRIDDEFRSELLEYLITQFEEQLAAAAGEDRQAEAAIRTAFKIARRAVSVDSDTASEAAEQFNAAVRDGLSPALTHLRRWCEQPGNEDVASILLPG